ncbi:NUDIX hydrolase [Vibrio brasiliensis]|uniref:MutT/nudix family protein n=1 Tax=Vibrio brasiliensis LMG 20546 TaxID=945543 RepID=E8LQK4_9VIBR|nr:NUDIX hydrolase [Vibrio brasiliensis]EGA67045.1 MutT/nudix family protein [Vibrio brasiliensis LMG 20546]
MKHLSMAIVVKNGKVLVQERFRTSKGKVFEFPGGAVNNNESGTDAAARELFEETKINGLSHAATFSGINDFGGRIYYAIFNANDDHEPTAVDSERQQTFHWLTPSELPLSDFYAADVDFIQRHLVNYA